MSNKPHRRLDAVGPRLVSRRTFIATGAAATATLAAGVTSLFGRAGDEPLVQKLGRAPGSDVFHHDAAGGSTTSSTTTTVEESDPELRGAADDEHHTEDQDEVEDDPTAIGRWSDPETWGGRVPGPTDVAMVMGPVLLDVDAQVAGVMVHEDGSLQFDPEVSRALNSSGNVVVHGRLSMRPARPSVVHALTFVGVEEAAFVGGGMEVVDSDVGLWVMRRGVLDVAGSPKTAWARATVDVAKGATEVHVDRDVRGWAPGDLLVLTPTAVPGSGQGSVWASYDEVRIRSITGNRIVLDRPTAHSHPVADLFGEILGAEVLNVTRNVRIGGTPEGRSHVLVHARRRQRISDVEISHVGPRQRAKKFTKAVLGRYGLHFHHCGDATRGSVIERVVVHRSGNHAFVPHESHGITLRDCVSHDTFEDAFWWDRGDTTHAAIWERCVASKVQFDPGFRGYSLTGFLLGPGKGSVARECVAVGVQGNGTGGFFWDNGHTGVWTFQDCCAHNNKGSGVRVWQNSSGDHAIRRLRSYRNAAHGVNHGAYSNRYHYEGGSLAGNGKEAIHVKAISRKDHGDRLTFSGLRCDANGNDYAMAFVGKPPVAFQTRTLVRDCAFGGYAKAGIGFVQHTEGTKTPTAVDVVDCAFDANEFWLGTALRPDSEIRVQRAQQALALGRYDQPGVPRAEWNASVRSIEPFA